MSLHDTSGMLISVSRRAEGRVCDSASSKSSRSTRMSCMRDAERGAMIRQVAGTAAQAAQAGVAAQFHQIGAEEAVRAARDLFEIRLRVVRQRHLARMDFKDFAPAGRHPAAR